MSTTRRSFITGLATSVAAPFILPSRVWAADNKPNSRLTMGCVGMGKQMGGLLGGFLHRVQVLAVCDVDTTRRNDAQTKVDKFYTANPAKGAKGCASVNDFRELIARKDIDVVCIATPDHWHTRVTLAALQAGKDVYCEKPLTHDLQEAIDVIKGVDANKRVLQTGSMQRSMKEFRIACELVQNGVIGKLERVECSFGDAYRPCDLPTEKDEPGLDWNLWLGPAPVRGYHSMLSPRGVHTHFPNWRAFEEYGGGQVCDWGAHHLDIAQWGLGMDDSGPVEIIPPAKAGAKRGAVLKYANGITVTHKDGIGVHFYGTEGEVLVDRGQFKVIRKGEVAADNTDKSKRISCESQVAKAEKEFLKDAKIKLYDSKSHQDDFLACVAARKKPVTSEQIGGRSAICCHLMNLAYKYGKAIKWDPARLAFAAGSGDPKWLTIDSRDPWKKA